MGQSAPAAALKRHVSPRVVAVYQHVGGLGARAATALRGARQAVRDVRSAAVRGAQQAAKDVHGAASSARQALQASRPDPGMLHAPGFVVRLLSCQAYIRRLHARVC